MFEICFLRVRVCVRLLALGYLHITCFLAHLRMLSKQLRTQAHFQTSHAHLLVRDTCHVQHTKEDL